MAHEDSAPPAIDLRHSAETDWPAVGCPLPLGECPSPVEPTARPLLAQALSASARCRERSTVPEHVSSLPEAVRLGKGCQRSLSCPGPGPIHSASISFALGPLHPVPTSPVDIHRNQHGTAVPLPAPVLPSQPVAQCDRLPWVYPAFFRHRFSLGSLPS